MLQLKMLDPFGNQLFLEEPLQESNKLGAEAYADSTA
jgi:hypothetical protein